MLWELNLCCKNYYLNDTQCHLYCLWCCYYFNSFNRFSRLLMWSINISSLNQFMKINWEVFQNNSNWLMSNQKNTQVSVDSKRLQTVKFKTTSSFNGLMFNDGTTQKVLFIVKLILFTFVQVDIVTEILHTSSVNNKTESKLHNNFWLRIISNRWNQISNYRTLVIFEMILPVFEYFFSVRLNEI